jgi:hypothetical protein
VTYEILVELGMQSLMQGGRKGQDFRASVVAMNPDLTAADLSLMFELGYVSRGYIYLTNQYIIAK